MFNRASHDELERKVQGQRDTQPIKDVVAYLRSKLDAHMAALVAIDDNKTIYRAQGQAAEVLELINALTSAPIVPLEQ